LELRQIVLILLRRWWLVLIPVVVTAVLSVPDIIAGPAAAGAAFTTTIHYSAAQQLEAQELPPRDGDYQDIWLASEYTVNALTAWALTDSFRQEIAAEAEARGLEVNVGALGIAADNERSIGQLTLVWPDGEELAVLAAATIEVLRERNQDYFPQLGGEPADVTILDSIVTINAVPAPLTNRFAPVLTIALGLAAGIGLAFLAHYVDPMLRRREDLEALGLTVVATLPRQRGR
jgi:capsular polysaccharide biosynthesis protein